ncbi:MAG: hypothetical protein O2856_01460 [Planctomycetota bacterium]|nr:hypothetical protein [Planctomycetota bacterium]
MYLKELTGDMSAHWDGVESEDVCESRSSPVGGLTAGTGRAAGVQRSALAGIQANSGGCKSFTFGR